MTEALKISGHLKIVDTVSGVIVFDRKNLIVNQGKGWVLDLLTSLGVDYGSYTPSPINSIVLTSNTAPATLGDTFENTVYQSGVLNTISDEGVLHVEVSGGQQVELSHTQGGLQFTAFGRISEEYGNDPANNQITSVCLCAGVNPAFGGPGQGAYVHTGNERVLARVLIGNLVKTIGTSYEFTWVITIE